MYRIVGVRYQKYRSIAIPLNIGIELSQVSRYFDIFGIEPALVLTNARIPLPHWRQSHKTHSDAVEITLRKLDGISCQRSAARRSYGANPEDEDTLSVT